MGKTGLNKAGKDYAIQWFQDQYFNRRSSIKSPYLDKGNAKEDDAIDFIAEQLGLGMLMKNEEFFQNDFACGTPDVITKDFIIDNKCSWSHSTFPLFKEEPPTDYYAQGQIYMWLTGVHKYKLIYTLLDTPQHLIEKEAYYWCRNNGYEELDDDVYYNFVEKMTYSDIPPEKRIKVFDFDFDSSYIEKVKKRVLECRELISNLKVD